MLLGVEKEFVHLDLLVVHLDVRTSWWSGQRLPGQSVGQRSCKRQLSGTQRTGSVEGRVVSSAGQASSCPRRVPSNVLGRARATTNA